jgi:hypothetical protein
MKQAVQHQNLDFLSSGVSEAASIGGGNFRRDSDFPRTTIGAPGQGREREHIGRPVLSKETAVERAHFLATRDQNIDRSTQPDRAAGTNLKPGQRPLSQTGHGFAKNDQAVDPRLKTNRRARWGTLLDYFTGLFFGLRLA